MNRLWSSVIAWIARRRSTRVGATFRRSGTSLDALMNVRTRRDATTPRTRIRQASFSWAPGRTVDWPGPPPAEWRRRHPEHYL